MKHFYSIILFVSFLLPPLVTLAYPNWIPIERESADSGYDCDTFKIHRSGLKSARLVINDTDWDDADGIFLRSVKIKVKINKPFIFDQYTWEYVPAEHLHWYNGKTPVYRFEHNSPHHEILKAEICYTNPEWYHRKTILLEVSYDYTYPPIS